MQTATRNPYTVRGIKSFQGREGYGYECSLYRDGKRIGKVVDTAHGGMVDFYLDKGEKEKLDTYCDAIPKKKWDTDDHILSEEDFNKFYPDGFPTDCDSFLATMVDAFEYEKKEAQRYKRLCKTKTVYLLKDSPESLWSIKSQYSEAVAERLRAKHGDNLKEIVNERYL